jgi:hypothetical protein
VSDEVQAFQAEGNYRSAIRSAVRGFWSGALDYDQFWEVMDSAINAGLTSAWYEGARECGIEPSELTPDEKAELRRRQIGELTHVGNFAAEVDAGSKANGGKLAPLFQRAEAWILRARDVMNQARVMACGDQKLMWELGITEKHCRSCAALNGKVKRASYWQQMGVRPQNPPNYLLACGGWLCDCRLVPTSAPLSKGPLPRLP